MALPRPASPRALVADIRAFARERSRVQWIAALVAVAMPAAIVLGFVKDARTNTAPPEQIVYAESWGADRSDVEIRAAQQERERRRAAAAAERQRQFKALGRKLGMDGD